MQSKFMGLSIMFHNIASQDGFRSSKIHTLFNILSEALLGKTLSHASKCKFAVMLWL